MTEGTERQTPDRRPAWRTASIAVAVIAGAFSIFVAWGMLAAHFTAERTDPLNNERLESMRTEVTERPDDLELTRTIRREERRLREQFLQAQDRLQIGVYLLTAGLAVFVGATKLAWTFHSRLPRPGPPKDARKTEARQASLARWAVGVLAFGLIGVGFVTAWPSWFARGSSTPKAAAGTGEEPASQPASQVASQVASQPRPYPTAQEVARNWPRFRGPAGRGISHYDDAPLRWDGTKDEGIAWKSPVPLPGYSSAIFWGDRVFVTGADAQTRVVYCFDAETGKQLWKTPVELPGGGGAPDAYDEQMFAAPTPCTDGRRVYALFSNGDLAALDYDGEIVWTKALGLPAVTYGYASSPAVYQGLLLIQFDESADPRLIALDARTGEEKYTVQRPVGVSWCTPIVAGTPSGPQAILSSDCWVIGYEPKTGKELWRADCMYGMQVGGSPVHADGKAYVAYSDAFLTAIPTDQTGDVTEKILWQGDMGLPQYTSPIATEKYVYLQDGSGIVTCYDAQNGKMLWDFMLDGGGYPSPSLVGEHMYVLDYAGAMYVLKLNGPEKPELIATNPLGEECAATPAFGKARIYIRARNHLYCITGTEP